MIRLFAILPFGFAIFFSCCFVDVARHIFNPRSERLLAFGVALTQLSGAIFAFAITYAVAFKVWEQR